MRKHANRIPPALKHGIYSGIGLLPTENPAEFPGIQKQKFVELALTGPSERVGEEIVALECTATTLLCNSLSTRGTEIR